MVPGADATLPVDISVSGVGCVVEGLTFGNVEGPLALPAGTCDVEVIDPGTYTVAIQTPDNQTTAFEADLELSAGTLYAVYAVGSVASGSFDVLLQTIQF